MGRSRYPYQYEEMVSEHGYTEPGSDGSAHLNVEALDHPALKRLMIQTADMKVPQTLEWIEQHKDEYPDGVYGERVSDKKTAEGKTSKGRVSRDGAFGEKDYERRDSGEGVSVDGASGEKDYERRDSGERVSVDGASEKTSLRIITQGLNAVKELNVLLNRTSEALTDGGYIWVHTNTSGIRKASIFRSNPPVFRNVIFFFWYLWYRVFPKLRLTRWFYILYERLRGNVNRCYHRVEILGRLYRAGFEVVDERFRYGHFFVVGRKVKEPMWEDEPTGSPIIKLHRVGKGGKLIPVFKFRTMHSYSEYLQGYVYKYNSLDKDGKFANDYRIAGYGKILRKLWLDELPMVVNLILGDVKLVGVRPISRQYYSLYSPEMQQLRIKVKPGILPPFYYERNRPQSMQEIEDSERRYTEAYLEHPFRTDWRYFWGTIGNILFRGARSK